MITPLLGMKDLPLKSQYKEGDLLFVFGELFNRGYANGIVDEAQKIGMKIIYSTVGRRDEKNHLRPLLESEIKEKNQLLINVPLEAGFDLEPAKSGRSPTDQLQNIKLSEGDKAKMNLSELEESRATAVENFRLRVKRYIEQIDSHLSPKTNVLFVHTMAGGVPRAKIIMPIMNRVFKGYGDRYASSQDFWSSDMGRFCAANFEEVTGNTLYHLIDLSSPIRKKVEKWGNHVSYVAYGYHGTEVLVDEQYRWQSYSPYLQGFAKIRLENIAQQFFQQGVKVTVFNSPEILTNSSSIFLGVEVSLYPLLGALEKEGGRSHPSTLKFLKKCQQLLQEKYTIQDIMTTTSSYMNSDVIREWSRFDLWPQHNGPEQMTKMREASAHLIGMHKDPKNLVTGALSEIVFRACGKIMLDASWNPSEPVWWLGHDIVAKQTNQMDEES